MKKILIIGIIIVCLLIPSNCYCQHLPNFFGRNKTKTRTFVLSKNNSDYSIVEFTYPDKTIQYCVTGLWASGTSGISCSNIIDQEMKISQQGSTVKVTVFQGKKDLYPVWFTFANKCTLKCVFGKWHRGMSGNWCDWGGFFEQINKQ